MQKYPLNHYKVTLCNVNRNKQALSTEEMIYLYEKTCGEECRHAHQVQQLWWLPLTSEEIVKQKAMLIDEEAY